MKKKIAIICCLVLVLASVFTVLAACDNSSGLSDESLKTLRANLYNQYKDDATAQNESYKVLGEITGFDANSKEIKSAILWTIEDTDKVTISSSKDDNGNYTVNVPDPSTLSEDISYILTATLVDGNGNAYKNSEDKPYSVSFDRKVEKYVGPKADATITFDSTAKISARGEAYTDQYNNNGYESITWSENGISVLNVRGESYSACAEYVNPVRFYGFSTLEISYTQAFKAIRINLNSPSSNAGGFDGMSVSGATIKREGDTVLIVLDTPAAKFTSDKLKAQTRINSIEIFVSEVPTLGSGKYETEEQILAALKELGEGKTLPGGEYSLTGTVSKLGAVSTREGEESNRIVYIEVGAEKFEIQCYYLVNGASLKEGDVITVTGYLKNFKGTIEFDSGCTYKKAGSGDVGTGNDVGSIDAPITVAKAIDTANELASDAYSTSYYYVKGIITKITYTGSATASWSFEMTDEGGTDVLKGFYIYLSDGMSTIKVGDVVIVYGKLQNYKGNTPEITAAKDDAVQAKIVKIDAGTAPEVKLPEATLAATLDTLGVTTRKSYSTTQLVHEANGVTYTQDKAASKTDCFDNTDNPTYATRAYANSNITIEYTSAIKYIVLTCNGSNITLAGQTFDGVTIVEDAANKTVTIILDDPATSVTLENLSKQLRIEKIEIYA